MMSRSATSLLLRLFAVLTLIAGAAHAQSYDTLANQPDLRDFVHREESRLILLGDAVRFMGYDVGWSGVRPDGTPPPAPPTPYEVRDVLATARALGGTVVRVRPIGMIAACAACAPPRIRPDPVGLATLDLVLKTARDAGLRVIVPLAGGGDCAAYPGDPICTVGRGRGLPSSAAFFSDRGTRTDFGVAVEALLSHVNALTGAEYRNDPTIFAWENCLACGAAAEPDAVSAWVEAVGHAIKSHDARHLYESGAFAGRIGTDAPNRVPPASFATESVDLVGDDLATGSEPVAARLRLEAVAALVAGAGKVYVMDNVAWSPSAWKTEADLQAWCSAMARQRSLSGAVAGRLVGHADKGRYLPAPPSVPPRGVAALYFPGLRTSDLDAHAMQERGRILRRFAYAMADVVNVPAYLLPPKPEIISAVHGHLLWRGSAGAAKYSVERSPDPGAPGTWTMLCDSCATDMDGGWQDPTPLSPPGWYRVTPLNVNAHASIPSDPVQGTR